MSFSLSTDFGDNFVTGIESVKGLGAFIDRGLYRGADKSIARPD